VYIKHWLTKLTLSDNKLVIPKAKNSHQTTDLLQEGSMFGRRTMNCRHVKF